MMKGTISSILSKRVPAKLLREDTSANRDMSILRKMNVVMARSDSSLCESNGRTDSLSSNKFNCRTFTDKFMM